MKFFQFEFIWDVCILLTDMCYLIIILRDYRHGTFLKHYNSQELAQVYYKQYSESPVNEYALLLVIAIMLWIKAFIQLKWL